MDFIKLILVLSVSLLVTIAFTAGIRDKWCKLQLIALLCGVTFYSGIGAARLEVPASYLFMFIIFLLSLGASYRFALRCSAGLRGRNGFEVDRRLAFVLTEEVAKFVLVIAVAVVLVPLLTPDWRVGDLLQPPAPKVFTLSKQPSNNLVWQVEIASFLFVLLYGLVLASFARLKWSPLKAFGYLLLLLYIEYVANEYIGRSAVLAAIAIVCCYLWVEKPERRFTLVSTALIVSPTLLLIADAYTVLRLGLPVSSIFSGDASNAMMSILSRETSLVKDVAIPVIESGEHASFMDYGVWLATLPIPSFLLPGLEITTINQQISELVLRVPAEHADYYGIMAGLVGEAVFIYTEYFFWVHGVMLGACCAVLMSIFSSGRYLVFVRAYIVVLSGYFLARGGVSSFMPRAVNELLGIVVVLLLVGALARNRTISRRKYKIDTGNAKAEC